MGTILACQEVLDVVPMIREEMEVNAMLIVAAGSESLTTVLVGVISYLLRNPDKMETLVTEIHVAFQSQEKIIGASLKHLPYLDAVLHEE